MEQKTVKETCQVCINQIWESVYSLSWDGTDIKVACRQLAHQEQDMLSLSSTARTGTVHTLETILFTKVVLRIGNCYGNFIENFQERDKSAQTVFLL